MTPIVSSPGVGLAPGTGGAERPLSLRALIGTHSAERMPRLCTLLPLLKRWSAIALVDSTPSPFWITWLMIVRDAWILGGWTPAEEPPSTIPLPLEPPAMVPPAPST